MNLPNKLTVLRIAVTPVFMLALMWDFKYHYIVALVLFIAASLTDMADGRYARKHNMITDFGKFLDPLADKMLTTAAFIAFVYLKIGKGIEWIVFIVLFREFLISSLRLVAVSSGGKVIAANIFGKMKTVSQMAAIIFAIFVNILYEWVHDPLTVDILNASVTVLLWISAILTVISGIVYMADNLQFINPDK